MDAPNPNAPVKALDLHPQGSTFESLYAAQFPKSSINRLSVMFMMQNGMYRLAQQLDQIPQVAERIKFFPRMQIVDVEIVINCYEDGAVVGAALTHDLDADASIQSLTAQKHHFYHRVTPFVSGTVAKSFKFYDGMSRQLRPPAPIDGVVPVFLLHTDGRRDGTVTLIINFDYGGSINFSPLIFSNLINPQPEPLPVFDEADGPYAEADPETNWPVGKWRAMFKDTQQLLIWFRHELGRHHMTLQEAGFYVVDVLPEIMGGGRCIRLHFDSAKKLCSVGFTVHAAYRMLYPNPETSTLEPSHDWLIGLEDSDTVRHPPVPPGHRDLKGKNRKLPPPARVGGTPEMVELPE